MNSTCSVLIGHVKSLTFSTRIDEPVKLYGFSYYFNFVKAATNPTI